MFCGVLVAVAALVLGIVFIVPRPVEVLPGDRIVFGNYNGESIVWRVLKVSENGKEATVVAEDILCMKAFDGAESGIYNRNGEKEYWGADISGETVELQRLLRGDNRWNTSNIRAWLYSQAENVAYQGRAPIIKAMSSMMNGYDTEAGFLYGFTEEERRAILVSDVETNGEITQDKVFLLSAEELEWFAVADVKVYAEPTEGACRLDMTDWYENYALDLGIKDFRWWLRDGSETDGYKVYLMGNSYMQGELSCESAALEGYGIRPALTLDLTSDCIEIEQK